MSKLVPAFLVVVVVLLTNGGSAQAQLTIPGVDAVNAYAQIGTIAPQPYSTVPSTTAGEADLWGYGVETEFDVPIAESSPWAATLGLAYSQLSLSSTIGDDRRLRGTLREWPALSLYFGRRTSRAYFGATIAISELVNGRIHSDPAPDMLAPAPIKVAATSFAAGVAVGYEYQKYPFTC